MGDNLELLEESEVVGVEGSRTGPLTCGIRCSFQMDSVRIGASQVVLAVKNLPAKAEDGDLGSICRSGRSPGGGHGNPLQQELENPHGQRCLVGIVHRVTKSQT